MSVLAPRRLLTLTTARLPLAAALASVLLLSGCHVTENRNGDSKKVDIGTPFGSVNVDTHGAATPDALGFSAYPGATAVDMHDKDGEDNGNNANVNVNFGGFHVGVQAATFQSSASQDAILAFYRADLNRRYGAVIECRGQQPVGSPARTPQGLSCTDSESTTTITTTDSGPHKGISIQAGKSVSLSHLELRAGSAQHQHIVALEPRDGGNKITLVALELPSHLFQHSDKNPE